MRNFRKKDRERERERKGEEGGTNVQLQYSEISDGRRIWRLDRFARADAISNEPSNLPRSEDRVNGDLSFLRMGLAILLLYPGGKTDYQK